MPEKSFPHPEKKPPSPPGQPMKHVPPEMDDPMEVIREYGRPVAIGIILALTIFLGYTGYRYYQHSTEVRAAELLTLATSAEELEHILAEYEDTRAAPMALLSLASAHYRDARYEEAHAQYARFLEAYPEHEMSPNARIGIAYCLEAMGRMDQAHDAFSEFAGTYPEHFMSPLATFGKARTLSLQGQYSEALEIYERFIEDNPESPWLPQAETARIYTEKNKRAAQAN